MTRKKSSFRDGHWTSPEPISNIVVPAKAKIHTARSIDPGGATPERSIFAKYLPGDMGPGEGRDDK
ncbi:hypothetical protein ABIB73_002480 [Bradyrhizobium sp. F1.4.3]